MTKGSIAFIVVVCIGLASVVIIYMKRSADQARKLSDEIVKEFKTVDKDLKQSNSKIDSANKALLDSLNNTLK